STVRVRRDRTARRHRDGAPSRCAGGAAGGVHAQRARGRGARGVDGAFPRTRPPRGRVLVVEPLAGGAAPWWKRWQSAFEAAGGRADEWRTRAELPPIVQKLDRAAGL